MAIEKQPEPQRTHGRTSNLPKLRTIAQPASYTTSKTESSRMGFGYRKTSSQPMAAAEEPRQQAATSQTRLKRMPAFNQPAQPEQPRRAPPPKPAEQWPLEIEEKVEEASPLPVAQRIPELDRYQPHQPHHPDPFSDGWYGVGHQDMHPMHSSQSSYSQYSSGYSAHSASPSTRFFESPRPGAYSRDTTPTSSPGLLPPFQSKPLLRQESPKFSRPPVTKRRMGSASDDASALSTVRESLTSSSSNSTVKDSAKEAEDKEKSKKKKKRLSPLPPSPPPRKSSAKFKGNPHSAETSPVKPEPARGLAMATMTSGVSPRIGTEESIEPSPQKSVASPPQSSLNVPSRIGMAPRRPSRDGTPDLSGLSEPARIVHSNLMSPPSSVESRSTTSRLPARKGAAPLAPLGIPRKATPAPAPAGLGFQLPDPRSAVSTPGSGLRTPSPSTANSATKHRFGLFGRREKSAAADAQPTEKKKVTRKGPAAGTGHEGYGRYAFGGRGRSNTLSSRERSLSNVSTTSQESFGSSMTAMSDPFFSQRSSPVVIAGGGKIVENYNNSSIDLSRTESNQSQKSNMRPSLESKNSHGSSRSNLSNTLFPSSARNNPAASSTSLASRASDSSDNHHWSPKKNLAARRSLLRLNKKDLLGLQPPKSIEVPGSRISGISTQSSMYDAPGMEAIGSQTGTNKLTKRAPSPGKKWHFFQRKPKVEKPMPVEAVTEATKNPLTYFAIDSDEEKSKSTIEELKDIMREAEVPEFHDIEIGYEKQEQLQCPPMRPRAGSNASFTLFPKIEEPKAHDLPPQSANETSIPMMWNNADRASPRMRLAQVGRIPKVVTSQPPTQATIISSPEMSERSYSRPFRLGVAREPAHPPTPNDPNSVALGPSPEKSPALPVEEKPFLAFSPRKTSEAGTTSSSSGIVSSYEGTTAVVPQPEEPFNDDEVWDEEFDDLMRTPSIESPMALINLRVGSMSVSKWLTFGHVLFSPARESLDNAQPSKHHSILVIDGVGNDDWSFYAAETYPEATFYNLTTSSQQPNSNRMSMSTTVIPARPVNHRQVHHTSLSNKFPFIPNTFTIVVLRFLAASSEFLMRHVIAESKRVLKPGGFLEMSVLDLDMRDMGPKTRRVVRDLKINVSLRDPEISLASTADTMLRLANKRGFTNIKSCNVGVPVATVVNNTSAAGTPMGGDFDAKEHKELRIKKEVSLADLMKNPDPAGDAGITKMVAKVGRWWFKQCYEKESEKSIFDDGKVLAECEKWETSFKLCVAHAQKGEARRRRTASV